MEEAYVLLHKSDLLFQAPDPEAHRGRLGVALRSEFPAELWPARVLATVPGWLLVRPVEAEQTSGHWSDPPPVLQALGLQVWVSENSPNSVVTEQIIRSWEDGSTIALSPGTPLSGGTALVRAGDATLAVTAPTTPDERSTRYRPGSRTGVRPAVGWLVVDSDLGFGRVGDEPLTRVPRSGRNRPATRIPLEEQDSSKGLSWGIVGSRTARVRTLIEPAQVRDGPGWGLGANSMTSGRDMDGWWVLMPGADLTWADATHAGQVRHPIRFDVEPVPEGERLCTWWQDLAGTREAAGITARWGLHASVVGETGLRICFGPQAVSPQEP